MRARETKILILATGNPGKVEEIKSILGGIPVCLVIAADHSLSLPEDEPYASFQENAAHKALFVARQTPHLVLGEDSGLEVDALGGRPGVFSKRYSGPEGNSKANNAKLLRELRHVPMAERRARFRCELALAQGNDVLFNASGTCKGQIAERPSGKGGFGYDPLFYLPDLKRSMAELSPKEKNRISHRSCALEKARTFIRQYALDS